jgi:hypothetical protein
MAKASDSRLFSATPGHSARLFEQNRPTEGFIESGVGRASVGDEAERQMSRKQIDATLAELLAPSNVRYPA